MGRGSDWTELMEYFGEQKGKELSLSTVTSQDWEVLVLGKEPECWSVGLLRGLGGGQEFWDK